MREKIGMVLIIFMFMSGVSFAQGNGGNNGNAGGNGKGKNPPTPFGPPHPELPIDSGISFLLLAGACYGAFTLRKKVIS